jgi:hypothetical protein
MNTIVRGKNVSGLLVGNRDVQTQDCVWIDGSGESFSESNIAFIEEVAAQPAARKFDERFPLGPNFDAVMAVAWKLYPNAPFITTSRFIDALKTLAAGSSDKLIAKPAAASATPAPMPAPPTDKNGRILSASQIQWGEMTHWSENASTSERKERARRDPAYARFVQKQWDLRLNENPVDGDMRPFNPQLTPAEDPSAAKLAGIAAKAGLLVPQLISWVSEYQRTPSAKVRSLLSLASNPLGAVAYTKARDAAIEANLL